MVLPEPSKTVYRPRKTVYRLARELLHLKQSFEGQSFLILTNIGVVFGLSTSLYHL